MIRSWDCTEDGIQYATIIDYRTLSTLRLVVEKLPDSEFWDWVVWQADATNITPRGGKEKSLSAAEHAAENAARNWIPDNRSQPC
jgi:hypothetical protein